MALPKPGRRPFVEDEDEELEESSASKRARDDTNSDGRLTIAFIIARMEEIKSTDLPTNFFPQEFVQALVAYAETSDPKNWRHLFIESKKEVAQAPEYVRLKDHYKEALLKSMEDKVLTYNGKELDVGKLE